MTRRVQRGKLRHRVVKLPAPGHTASMWPCWGPEGLGNLTGHPGHEDPPPPSSVPAVSSGPGL